MNDSAAVRTGPSHLQIRVESLFFQCHLFGETDFCLHWVGALCALDLPICGQAYFLIDLWSMVVSSDACNPEAAQ